MIDNDHNTHQEGVLSGDSAKDTAQTAFRPVGEMPIPDTSRELPSLVAASALRGKPVKRQRWGRTRGITAAAVAVLLVAGIVPTFGCQSSTSTDTSAAPSSATELAPTESEIVTPSSYDAIYQSLEQRVFSSYAEESDSFLEDIIPFASSPDNYSSTDESSSAGDLSGTAPSTSLGGVEKDPADFSQTNTQVEGIDEADIVKTDGEYIYSLYGYEVIITRAGGEDTKPVSNIIFNTSLPEDMYIAGDRLVIMSNGANDYFSNDQNAISYGAVYDISNAAHPQLLMTFGQDGSLRTSRLVDGTLYMVSVYTLRYDYSSDSGNPETYIPRLYEDAEELSYDISGSAELLQAEDIRILPEYESARYTVVSTIDVDKAERLSKLSILGDTTAVYMSHDNLFLAATSYNYLDIMPLEGEEQAKSLDELRVPILPWDRLAFVLDPDGWFNNDQRDYTMADVQEVTSSNHPITRFTRIALGGGYPEVSASEVYTGELLNQFSLDEYDGYLRVALTVTEDLYYEDEQGNEIWQGAPTSNSLLVLDQQLKEVGSIEDLAQGERIYSVRLMGELGYMVTFRQTDPLFSLDLSDPSNPEVMDALKIPGFSEYLHPYDDGLLLGFGRETDESGFITSELKLSMFDVSDPFDLREQDKQLISAYSSPALENHKAFLINKEKNLIGFQIETETEQRSADEIVEYQFQSYYMIYGYDEELGFTERAAIKLKDTYTESRALYIDEYLYIVNGENLGIFDLETLEELAWIEIWSA